MMSDRENVHRCLAMDHRALQVSLGLALERAKVAEARVQELVELLEKGPDRGQ